MTEGEEIHLLLITIFYWLRIADDWYTGKTLKSANDSLVPSFHGSRACAARAATPGHAATATREEPRQGLVPEKLFLSVGATVSVLQVPLFLSPYLLTG